MRYFKKAALAETYHISEKTVTNWIKEAKTGKLGLELHEENGRAWVANTTRNIELIEQLVEERKKYRNSRGLKAIVPKSEFYQIYNQQQIFDIASNLDIHHEIPLEYAYFNGGADYWDKYVERLATEKVPNNLTNTMKLLRVNQGYFGDLIAPYKRVNVVDIGPGNAAPARETLQYLLDHNKLGRYIALDISPAILKLVERNVRDWFGGKVHFEAHQIDANYNQFTDLLVEEMIDQRAKDTVSIVLALGDTFSNFRAPDGAFKIIHDSMNRNDLLFYDRKLDSKVSRQYFDLGIRDGSAALDAHKKMVVDLLNIDESLYDVEMGYDEQSQSRYMRIRLKVAISITFTFDKGDWIVELNKNDAILVWRSWHQNVAAVVSQLERTGFDTLQTSTNEDKTYLLTISRVTSEH